jgi:hydroxymethylpyrimidine/phosphomethylpyrimidine kinase
LTAITAQNTRGVSAVHAIPADIVRAQVHAVATDLDIRACKTGMLATRELVQLVAELIREEGLPNYVLDPVMVATSADRLLDRDAEVAIVERLLPLCTIVTPNLDEAAILCGFEVGDEAAMKRAAHTLVQRGAQAALVKGGHLRSEQIVDLLYDGEEFTAFRRAKIATSSTHGTGCTLSAAVAAGLAHGRDLHTAVTHALQFVERAIRAAPGLGHGHGPLNHFVPVSS